MLLVYAAPRIFPMVYNIVKHFIEEDTKQKIVIMGGISLSLSPSSVPFSLSTDNWREELQKYISADQLPQAYGGTRCEPDPQCSDHVRLR